MIFEIVRLYYLAYIFKKILGEVAHERDTSTDPGPRREHFGDPLAHYRAILPLSQKVARWHDDRAAGPRVVPGGQLKRGGRGD